jgi:nitrite reductase/ring-hydroxylating ferredoxin subunit
MTKMLCDTKDIENNTVKPIKINTSKEILVGKIYDRVFACNNYCPHRGALLSKSKLKPNENRIVCYMHYFEYDLTTGKLEHIPDIWKGQSAGWKESADLELYNIEKDIQGNVFVDVPNE